MDIDMVIFAGFAGLGLLYIFIALVERAQKRELKQLEEAQRNKQTSGASPT